MIGDLFDSPWKLLIIAALILVLFGSRKLPGAARSLGRSMRILKHEVRGLGDDDESDGADSDREQPQAQRQIEQKPDRQRQSDSPQQPLSDLQQPEAGDGAVLNGAGSAETRRTQQPS